MDVARIDQAVAEEYGIDPEMLKAHGRRAGEAKAMAMELACRLTGWTQRAVGAYYGGVGSAAVCVARRKIRQRGDVTAKAVRRLEDVLSKPSPGQAKS